MTSLSTRFLGQPRLTKPIFFGAIDETASSSGVSRATDSSLSGMQSPDFSIYPRITGVAQSARNPSVRCERGLAEVGRRRNCPLGEARDQCRHPSLVRYENLSTADAYQDMIQISGVFHA